MDHIGIDVHKKECQICILAEGGELIEDRIAMVPARFAAVPGQRRGARILFEASTDSEWVARCVLQNFLWNGTPLTGWDNPTPRKGAAP